MRLILISEEKCKTTDLDRKDTLDLNVPGRTAAMAIGSAIGELSPGGNARVEQGLALLSDGQLLRLFAGCRNESAFATLVGRHGSMVLGVCRQLLGDRHE